jgi:hypothetical protein
MNFSSQTYFIIVPTLRGSSANVKTTLQMLLREAWERFRMKKYGEMCVDVLAVLFFTRSFRPAAARDRLRMKTKKNNKTQVGCERIYCGAL